MKQLAIDEPFKLVDDLFLKPPTYLRVGVLICGTFNPSTKGMQDLCAPEHSSGAELPIARVP
jgi:hypothetical protein